MANLGNMPVMWGGSAGGTPDWAQTAGGLLQAGGAAYGMYNASQLQGNAQTVFNQSNPFGQYRPAYGQQLAALMADPSSVSQLPGYQFLMDQGIQAIDRSAAAPGGKGRGSGGEMTDLVKYGQGLADQFYQQQVQTLSGLAGANINPANPAQALQGLGGAAGSLGNSISGLSSAAGVLGKLFPGGTAAGSANAQQPGSYDPGSSPFTGQPGQTSVDWTGDTSGQYSGWQMPGEGSTDFSGAPGQTSVDWGGGGTDTSVPSFDLGDMFSNPKSAGGQAAPTQGVGTNMASNWGNIGTGLGYASAGLGVAAGLASGKPTGEAGAALTATKFAASKGAFGANSGTIGSTAVQGMNVLGLYSGLKQGGVAGYAQAANSAYGIVTGSAGIPGVGQALAVYDFAKNWQSGDTGGDALRGAEAGASIGTLILPGIGTLVGGAIGGAVGAISSVFGNGKVDPENASFNGFTQAYNKASTPQAKAAVAASTSDPYLPLAGLFDLRSNQIKGNIPIVSQYGRMGEGQFVKDMFSTINQGVKAGTISKASSTDEIMSKVVAPWITSFGKGAMQDSNTDAINAMIAGIVDDYRTGQQGKLKAIGGDAPFTSVPAFGS